MVEGKSYFNAWEKGTGDNLFVSGRWLALNRLAMSKGPWFFGVIEYSTIYGFL